MKAFLLGCLLVLTCWGQQAQEQEFDRLNASSPQPLLASPLQWVSVAKSENASAFMAMPAVFVNSPTAWPFVDAKRGIDLPTSPTQGVWMRFTLAATVDVDIWYLRMPKVNLRQVSLFTRDAKGAWQVQSAGSEFAPAKWPLRTRTPTFELKTSTTAPQTYFMYFDNPASIAERPQLLSTQEFVAGAYRVGALLGLLLGTFSLLAALCVAAYAMARNTHFLWLCNFVAMLLFSQLTMLGFSGWQLWPNSQHLNQTMPWALSLATLAAGTWFAARASHADDTHPALYRLMGGLSVISLLMAAATVIQIELISRDVRNAWSVFTVALVLGSLGWLVLRGNRVNGWLLLGLTPIGLAALARLAYNWGWLAHVEIAQLIAMLAYALGAFILLAALAWHSRAALLSGGRAQVFADYDPETGCLLAHKAKTRLPRLLLRGGRTKLGSGVMMVRWVDADSYNSIVATTQRAELLRKIGKVLLSAARDVDSVVRHDESHFLILLEGPISRDAMATTASQIMTAAIRASQPKTKSNGPLSINLQIAMWQETLGTTSAANVMALLNRRLNLMLKTPQRRVQFIDSSAVSDLGSDEQSTSKRQKEVLDKINELEGEPTQIDSLR